MPNVDIVAQRPGCQEAYPGTAKRKATICRADFTPTANAAYTGERARQGEATKEGSQTRRVPPRGWPCPTAWARGFRRQGPPATGFSASTWRRPVYETCLDEASRLDALRRRQLPQGCGHGWPGHPQRSPSITSYQSKPAPLRETGLGRIHTKAKDSALVRRCPLASGMVVGVRSAP